MRESLPHVSRIWINEAYYIGATVTVDEQGQVEPISSFRCWSDYCLVHMFFELVTLQHPPNEFHQYYSHYYDSYWIRSGTDGPCHLYIPTVIVLELRGTVVSFHYSSDDTERSGASRDEKSSSGTVRK